MFLPSDSGVANIGTGTLSNQQSTWEKIVSTISNTVLTGIALFRTPKQNFVNPPMVIGTGGSAGGAAAPPSTLFGLSTGTVLAIGAGIVGLGVVVALASRR